MEAVQDADDWNGVLGGVAAACSVNGAAAACDGNIDRLRHHELAFVGMHDQAFRFYKTASQRKSIENND